MRPNEVKPYSESYQHLWKIRESYQEFRFTIMNMMVDDAYDKTDLESKAKTTRDIFYEEMRTFRVLGGGEGYEFKDTDGEYRSLTHTIKGIPKRWVPLETAQKLEERVKAGQHLEKTWREEIKELEKQIAEAKKILNELTKEVLDKWCWTDDCPTNCNDCRFNVNFKRLREALK